MKLINIKYVLISLCLCIGTGVLFSQNKEGREFCVDFLPGKVEIEPSYMSNASTLNSIVLYLDSVMRDSTIVLVRVEFDGAASPEGHAALNARLSQERLKAIETYVRNRVLIPDSVINRNDRYIPWGALIDIVEGDDISHKEEILSILRKGQRNVLDVVGRYIDARVKDLERLPVWNEIKRRYFTYMRKGCVLVVIEYKKTQEIEPVEIIEQDTLEKIEEKIDESDVVFEEKVVNPLPHVPHYISIKSNAVYAAALIFNAGLEFQLSRHLSIDVMGVYSPYDLFCNDRKIRTYGIQPELRYWFGDKIMERGHFIGLHTFAVGYNIQLNDKYRYQDPNHATWGVGLSYGYMLPISRNGRWGLELVLGAGYANVVYDTYRGVGLKEKIGSTEKDYWGITRLGVNFSYKFDIKKDKTR